MRCRCIPMLLAGSPMGPRRTDYGAGCLPLPTFRSVALVLVDARRVRSVEAGILAFRMWALPDARKHTPEAILALADEKARA